MAIISISSLDVPEVQVYSKLTEAQLRNRLNPAEGIFIAESPKVIKVALDAGYQPLSLLCESKHITGDAAEILSRLGDDIPVYTGSRELLSQLTGYVLTRGVLCAMRRKDNYDVATLCKDARRIAVIDGVVDTTNIGSIFRSAAALGMDAVLLTPASCDPLNRRSVRVSMGSVFLIPWGWLTSPVHTLSDLGFTTIAMALRKDTVSLGDERLHSIDKMAIVMGTEGEGLSSSVIDQCDLTVKIPMYHNVDSLNVGAAAAVAFFELRHHH